jgi:hypothetical protein
MTRQLLLRKHFRSYFLFPCVTLWLQLAFATGDSYAGRPLPEAQAGNTGAVVPRLFLSNSPVAQGKLVMYYSSWGNTLHRLDLGLVRGGYPELPTFDTFLAALDVEAKQQQWADQFWIVLETPESGAERHGTNVSVFLTSPEKPAWYQTPQLVTYASGTSQSDVAARWSGEKIYQALPAWIAKLGASNTNVVSIPTPVLRTIWLKNLDASPRVGQSLTVQPFVTRSNHCGVHLSFRPPPATLISDRDGKVQFYAPLKPLAIETGYLVRRDASSSMQAGQASADTKRQVWASEGSIDVGAKPAETLTQQWSIATAERRYEITVIAPAGVRLPVLTLGALGATNTCGASSYPVGQSVALAHDATARPAKSDMATIVVALDFNTIDLVWIAPEELWDNSKATLYNFSAADIAELIRFGRITVHANGAP